MLELLARLTKNPTEDPRTQGGTRQNETAAEAAPKPIRERVQMLVRSGIRAGFHVWIM